MKNLESKKIAELQSKIESALDHVQENYPGLCDPTSEHASESPMISYHEGCYQLFLHELFGATGDPELAWFNDESNVPDLDAERDVILQLESATCPDCGTIQFGEGIESCSQCGTECNNNEGGK